ncbi:hypothetical protein TUM4438_31150 [Shewanella sairae]|uniref:Uncharacterized protein n=1 Tax=Shewanella sairae TaxID=190310 RepID=A0ABQ4PLD2_9GAMM|nr:hypothetical protein [Shewanella sairae]MCL1131885.1 hypothetical protein [Shewanella sairae]GIU48848.1 hypothetical protein TUM4438_31150 [Shewanella sairae]
MYRLISTTLLLLCFAQPAAHAASEAECAIWLCLPTGFGSGCGDAKDAFKDRIKKFKPPLPEFLGCVLSDSSMPNIPNMPEVEMSSKEGVSARLENGRIIDGQECYCNGDWCAPQGCVETLKWVETYIDGVKSGERYYY